MRAYQERVCDEALQGSINNLNIYDHDIAHPCLFLSINVGMTDRTYVHEQIRRRMTSSSDWKLNRADFEEEESAQSLCNML